MSVILYSEKYSDAALVHDHLYEYNVVRTGNPRQDVVLKPDTGLKTFLFCADDEGKDPAGGIVWRIHEAERVLFVEFLWIRDDARGLGGGRLLLQAVFKAAAGHGCAAVELFTYTFQSPGFYLKHGFRIVKQHPSPIPLCPDNIFYYLRREIPGGLPE